MCVICVKPKNVAMPPKSWIENMWYVNHDGAGFMYADGKNVIISKGYMKLEDFERALDKLGEERDLKKTALVLHFRIGTAGGNIPANTHPFPVTDSIPLLQKLNVHTKLGVAHNGIIDITTRQKDISDTMEYIAAELSALYRYDNEFYRSKDLLKMIANRTTSKWAIMNQNGEVYTVGAFVEDMGCLFSNTSYSSAYIYRRAPVAAYGIHDGDWLRDDWYYGDYNSYIDDLMLLNDDEYIIDEDTGEIYGVDEGTFFIDRDGMLYAYDDFTQSVAFVDGNYRLFSSEGGNVEWNKDAASAMIVSSEEVTLSEYLGYYKTFDSDDKDEKKDGEEDKIPMPF